MAKQSEPERYTLVARGHCVEGEWSHYTIRLAEHKTDVGTVTKRGGGGWVATLPVIDPTTYRKTGNAFGRGPTPEDALAEADRRALQGITD